MSINRLPIPPRVLRRRNRTNARDEIGVVPGTIPRNGKQRARHVSVLVTGPRLPKALLCERDELS